MLFRSVKANAFAEFHRILKNDAIFIFSINEGVYVSYNFGEAIANYEKLNKWEVLTNEKKVYIEKKNIDAYYVTVRIKK